MAALGAGSVHDSEARVTGEGGGRRVVVLFAHRDFPGVRFGYRCKPPGEDRYEDVWVGEELATGALHRMMHDESPTPDPDGVVWTRLHGALLGEDRDDVEEALVLRAFAHLVATVGGATCGVLLPGPREPRACGAPGVAMVDAASFGGGVVDEDLAPLRDGHGRAVGACPRHLGELRRRAELRGAAVTPVRPGAP